MQQMHSESGSSEGPIPLGAPIELRIDNSHTAIKPPESEKERSLRAQIGHLERKIGRARKLPNQRAVIEGFESRLMTLRDRLAGAPKPPRSSRRRRALIGLGHGYD